MAGVGWGVAESPASGCLISGEGLSRNRSPGVSCNPCTRSLSPQLRLLLLLLTNTQEGWRGGEQLRGCGEVGASHICTRAHTHRRTSKLTARRSRKKLTKNNLPSDNP